MLLIQTIGYTYRKTLSWIASSHIKNPFYVNLKTKSKGKTMKKFKRQLGEYIEVGTDTYFNKLEVGTDF